MIFTWRLEVETERTRLVLVGEVDIAAGDELLVAVDEVASQGLPLVVELGGVTFLDGSGISALMAITQVAVDRGITIGFTDRPPVVDRILDLTDTSLAAVAASSPAGPSGVRACGGRSMSGRRTARPVISRASMAMTCDFGPMPQKRRS